MTSLRSGTATAPEATRPPARTPTEPVDGWRGREPSRRRTVELAVLAELAELPSEEPPPPVVVTPEPPADRPVVPTSRDGWLRLAERVVGDWAATLRVALAVALLFVAAIVVIGLVFGLVTAAVATAAASLVFLAGRSGSGPPQA